MKNIKIEKTQITEDKIKFKGSPDKKLNYCDLIGFALDIIPQGGFTPINIKERNRIQDSLDNSDGKSISLEDADYENLVNIIKISRWIIRDRELYIFLQGFEK